MSKSERVSISELQKFWMDYADNKENKCSDDGRNLLRFCAGMLNDHIKQEQEDIELIASMALALNPKRMKERTLLRTAKAREGILRLGRKSK